MFAVGCGARVAAAAFGSRVALLEIFDAGGVFNGADIGDEAPVANGTRDLLCALDEVEGDAAVHAGVVADGFPSTAGFADCVEDRDTALLDFGDVGP